MRTGTHTTHKSDTRSRTAHQDNTRPTQAKAEARQLPGEDAHDQKPGKGPPGCLGSAGEDRMHAKLGTRLGSDGAATHTLPPKHTLTQKHIHGTADIEQRREQLEAQRMPKKKKPNR